MDDGLVTAVRAVRDLVPSALKLDGELRKLGVREQELFAEYQNLANELLRRNGVSAYKDLPDEAKAELDEFASAYEERDEANRKVSGALGKVEGQMAMVLKAGGVPVSGWRFLSQFREDCDGPLSKKKFDDYLDTLDLSLEAAELRRGWLCRRAVPTSEWRVGDVLYDGVRGRIVEVVRLTPARRAVEVLNLWTGKAERWTGRDLRSLDVLDRQMVDRVMELQRESDRRTGRDVSEDVDPGGMM